MPKAHTPFQWFGQNTMEELRRKVGLLKDAARGTRGLTLRWHDPEATAVEGLVSRGDRRMGAVIEHVWRAGGTFQEWSEHFDLGLWTDALEAAGLDLDDVVYRHRDERRGRCPGTTSRPGCTATSCGRTSKRPWPSTASRTAAGLRATTAGPVPGSGSSTWWPRPVPPAGGSQGTGQDLAAGGTVPVRFLETAGAVPGRAAAGSASVKIRVRFTKLGRVRWTSHRDVARMWERALRRARVPVAYTAGFTPRPQLSFGLALPTGCESDRRVPRHGPARAGRPRRAGPRRRARCSARGRRRRGGHGARARRRTRSRRT